MTKPIGKYYILLLCQALLGLGSTKKMCEEKLSNCTSMMQPVLNEVRYMFPTSQPEIEGMCKMWSHIMDCVTKYMADCSTLEQKTKFNKAVSNSIDSVHAICSSDRHRRDYLENASCFKKVSMDSCGMYFKKMVESAYNPQSLELHICCAYTQYEKCVSEPIQRLCGAQTLHLLDDSMSSLKSRCDIITQTLKTSGNICPVPETPQQNAYSAPQRRFGSPPQTSPRIAPQQFVPLSTSAYLVSNPLPFTTPSWTPRTVIYPLPVTRHSSRVSRTSGSSILTTTKIFAMISTVFNICVIYRMVWS